MQMQKHRQLSLYAKLGGVIVAFVLFIILHESGLLRAIGTIHIVPLFGGLFFAGAWLPNFLFAKLVSVSCPQCGGAAFAEAGNSSRYVCRACDQACNASDPLMLQLGALSLEEKKRHPEGEKRPAGGTRAAGAGKLLMLAVAAGSLAVALYLAWDSIQLLTRGQSVEARVAKVEVHEHRPLGKKTEVSYTATIEFTAGQTPSILRRSWTVEEGSFCLWPCYMANQSLRVRYLPGHPESAAVDSIIDLFGFPLLLALFGATWLWVWWGMRGSRRSVPES
jgi:hypothetical protein